MTATSPWIELSVPERRSLRLRLPAGIGSVLFGVLLAALALSALRVRATDLRYRHADAMKLEQQLLDEKRRLEVEVQSLKDPMRLQQIAREQGFATPERIVRLPLRLASR
ncbi:hypothetical protein MYXO_01946 [Myxococcaceae bacterium]|jgi:cell division protein FtsL|nr:hypothetical protein MYXO_01946 [Myxococcaceae bacterium]